MDFIRNYPVAAFFLIAICAAFGAIIGAALVGGV
jgi:hypothetical protein